MSSALSRLTTSVASPAPSAAMIDGEDRLVARGNLVEQVGEDCDDLLLAGDRRLDGARDRGLGGAVVDERGQRSRAARRTACRRSSAPERRCGRGLGVCAALAIRRAVFEAEAVFERAIFSWRLATRGLTEAHGALEALDGGLRVGRRRLDGRDEFLETLVVFGGGRGGKRHDGGKGRRDCDGTTELRHVGCAPFGNWAASERPLVLRPRLATGLPFRLSDPYHGRARGCDVVLRKDLRCWRVGAHRQRLPSSCASSARDAAEDLLDGREDAAGGRRPRTSA